MKFIRISSVLSTLLIGPALALDLRWVAFSLIAWLIICIPMIVYWEVRNS